MLKKKKKQNKIVEKVFIMTSLDEIKKTIYGYWDNEEEAKDIVNNIDENSIQQHYVASNFIILFKSNGKYFWNKYPLANGPFDTVKETFRDAAKAFLGV